MTLPAIQNLFHSSWNPKVPLEVPFLDAFAKRIGSMLARAIEARYNKAVVVDILSPAASPVCVLRPPAGKGDLPSGLLENYSLTRFGNAQNPQGIRPIPLHTLFRAVQGEGNWLQWKGSRILETYEIAQRTLAPKIS